jgi:hypothetical protein
MGFFGKRIVRHGTDGQREKIVEHGAHVVVVPEGFHQV